MNKPVKTVKKEEITRKSIDLNVYPSAGPYPNVTGMKRLYWGKDAYCIRVGIYVYKVTEEIYNLF